MTFQQNTNGTSLHRGTGLLVIEVRYSNPNGDPDSEGEPRTIDTNGHGLISPVSFKRKLRDLVANKDGDAWTISRNVLKLEADEDKRVILHNTRRGLDHPTEKEEIKAKYNVLETRFRVRDEIKEMDASKFAAEFWDARIFGSTFLESLQEKDEESSNKNKSGKGKTHNKLEKMEKRSHFINTGVVQFGPGVSVAPILVVRGTWTSKAGVQEDKERGMAPLASRAVQHAVYVMPFFVNACMTGKTGCGLKDIQLMQFLIPYAYPLNPSVARPQVEILHAWYAEHQSPLGSCPDSLIIDPMTPEKTEGSKDEPSASIKEYRIPKKEDLPGDIKDRLSSFEDLCTKQWA